MTAAMTELGYVTYGNADTETAIATVLELDPEHAFLVRRTRVTFRTATGELRDRDVDFLGAALCHAVLDLLGQAVAS